VRRTFFVPVRTSKAGTLALQTGRLRSGERIGLAFTSEASLLLTLGPSQEWIRLGGQALKDMLAPLGVEHLRIDPRPIAELGVGAPLAEPAGASLTRGPDSGPRDAGPGCPGGHHAGVAARLASRHYLPASGQAATRRRGAAALAGRHGHGRELSR
jgi:hypothetical protein